MNDLVNVNISLMDAEIIIHSIHRTTQALSEGIFGITAKGIMCEDENLSEEANARDWISRYFELTAGVIQLISAASGVLSVAIGNGELQFAGEKKAKMRNS